MISLRENWRIVMLVVFLLASAVALVGPIGGTNPGTQTEFVDLSGPQQELTLEQSTLQLDNTTLETTNESETIVASNATIEVRGEITDRTDSSAQIFNGSVTVADGTLVVPENATDISRERGTVGISDEMLLRAENSEVTLAIEQQVDSGLTNLQYGFDLAGGTRIRAPLVGLHVTDIDIGANQTSAVNEQIAAELGVEQIDVSIRGGTIEVFNDDVNKTEFANALQAAGYDIQVGDVNDGVTSETRDQVVSILQSKIDRTGLSGGTVTTVGDGLVVVEVPNAEPADVRDTVSDRGVVEIVASVREPGSNTTTNTTVITGEDIANTGQIGPRENAQGEITGWEAPVTLNDQGAQKFQSRMNELNFTDARGIGNCDVTGGTGASKSGSYCLVTTLDGESVRYNGMGKDLAGGLRDGSWSDTPTFTIGASSAEQAQEVKISLEVGSLPTNLDLTGSEHDISYLQPSLAQEFKSLSLLTGLLAWFGVAGMVFLRYRKVRVAVPMIFTAIAEVFILLGFAAVSGLALDLSHIAGLIAVIGTGVDDLVIIADEILQQGEVATGRVFQNRFRKAFWVIGAAAVTTIIAMSPLTFLSVGDLFGFAIVTIVGVLIGVLITRPAYGDILRNLVLSEDQR